jgi:cytochrome c oxidase subunit IV
MTRDAHNTRRLWQGPVLTWALLVLLLAVSLGSAYIPLGIGNVSLNLLIAVAMAITLAIFLMDLRNAQALVRVVAVAGLFWTVLMFTLIFSDYLSRN